MPLVEKINPAELFVPEIRDLLKKNNLLDLKKMLAEINPVDQADAFSDFEPMEQVTLLRQLDRRRVLVVFEELDVLQQEFILHHLGADAFPHSLIQQLEKQLRRGRVETRPRSGAASPDSVGSMMETGIVPLKPDLTVRETLEFLRAQLRVRDEQTLLAFYVTNDAGQPIGAVTPRTILAAPADSRISEIMIPGALTRLPAAMHREEAARLFTRYKLNSAPVVDEEGRLVGTVSADEMLGVLQKEATEDIQKLGATESLDEPYFKISLLKMIRLRGTWLCVLFLGEMLTATAMGYFEKEIARAVVLALFIPLIISSGGNSGSQAATLIVRAMALQEIRFKDWWRVMRRELAAGLALGLILGAIGFLRIFIWAQFTPIYGPHYLLVAMTVASSLVLVVLWGSLSGSLLPIVLRRVGLDPAVVSAPFVATLVDVTGLVIYFVTGMLILKGTLL